ncbi:uncharacterized protein [Primulina huaijiensis]|uniref:uncharacterized protein n=1 Tax=Primulina huaijiensis TaxID=1492673 RepID=UPI003CC75262
MNCKALMNQDEHIQSVLHKQSKQMQNDYRIRLNASIDCIRVLDRNKEINDVILKNAPKNCTLTSPDIQKDIVSACATETINVIIRDVGDSLFSILVDESHDLSTKEQMSFVIVMWILVNIYNLSMSILRGQGFNGTSNLQLALIVVAKKNIPISNFFRVVCDVLNVVGASFKRFDLLREKHSYFIVEALERCEISSGRVLNQETTLQRAGDTHWGSHKNSLISLNPVFSAVIDVIEIIS